MQGNVARRIFLDGKAPAATLSKALRKRLPGTPSYEDQFQRCIGCTQYGDAQLTLATQETLDSDLRGRVHITLTTHDLDEDRFAAAREDWWVWWCRVVDSPELAVA
jgi:hypothetical protein